MSTYEIKGVQGYIDLDKGLELPLIERDSKMLSLVFSKSIGDQILDYSMRESRNATDVKTKPFDLDTLSVFMKQLVIGLDIYYSMAARHRARSGERFIGILYGIPVYLETDEIGECGVPIMMPDLSFFLTYATPITKD